MTIHKSQLATVQKMVAVRDEMAAQLADLRVHQPGDFVKIDQLGFRFADEKKLPSGRHSIHPYSNIPQAEQFARGPRSKAIRETTLNCVIMLMRIWLKTLIDQLDEELRHMGVDPSDIEGVRDAADAE